MRRAPVAAHALINQIAEQTDEKTLGGRLPAVGRTVAHHRCRVQPAGGGSRRPRPKARPHRGSLPPLLTATAQAQRDGRIGAEHVKINGGFLDRLPSFVDLATREHAQANLANRATELGPDDGIDPDVIQMDHVGARGADEQGGSASLCQLCHPCQFAVHGTTGGRHPGSGCRAAFVVQCLKCDQLPGQANIRVPSSFWSMRGSSLRL